MEDLSTISMDLTPSVMAASEEVLSMYATLSFGAIHVANDADSTVREECSVWVSVGVAISASSGGNNH